MAVPRRLRDQFKEFLEEKGEDVEATLGALGVDELNNARIVRTEAELADAIVTHSPSPIVLADDITTTGHINPTLSGENVTLRGNGHTITRGAGVQANILTIDTTGEVSITDLTIDANRGGLNFPTVKGYKELTVSNATDLRIHNTRVFNNQGFSFNIVGCDDVRMSDIQVDTNPSGLGSDAAGLDGIHIYDATSVNISNPQIVSGDDAICVHADTQTVEKISVSGGTLSSPEHANGVRIEVRDTATAGVSLNTVSVNSAIKNVGGNGVSINDASGNNTPIEDLSVAGSIANATDSGVKLATAAQNCHISASIADVANDGVDAFGGGDTLNVSASIRDAGRRGVRCSGWNNVRISGAIDGMGNMGKGIELKDSTDISITATIQNTLQRAQQDNGIELGNCQNVTITGCAISGVDAPISSFNGSDYLVITGNVGHTNTTASPSTVGANTLVANNAWH